MDDLKVNKELFKAIAEEIHSDKSPVGIDAKKTHVLILEKLIQLEKRLDRIEANWPNIYPFFNGFLIIKSLILKAI